MSTYVIADLHLGDRSTANRRADRFSTIEAMEREIVRRWNAVVSDRDVVFLLGDVGKKKGLPLIKLLTGTKHLVVGNADDLATIHQSGLFASVKVARWLPGFLLTHIPVHASQLRAGEINVHGHLHTKTIPDPRYRCVSVEQTDYGPVRLDG